jgi:hypothetical protein
MRPDRREVLEKEEEEPDNTNTIVVIILAATFLHAHSRVGSATSPRDASAL